MNQINEATKRKIFEKWIPKLKKRLTERGITVNEKRLQEIALMAHTRKIFESATLGNTPGRGAFSFGNNPTVANDNSIGSAEMFQKLFGVFVDVSATTVALDLLPVIPMNKSSITMVVAEPVYAGGKRDSKSDRLMVFQVKTIAESAPDAFVVGKEYEVKLGATSNTALKVEFLGKHLYNGNAIFKLKEVDAAQKDKTVAEILDSATTNAGIYKDATNYWKFDSKTVDYVNGFTNFVGGFTGAGYDDADKWGTGRNDGKTLYNPMDRETGETTPARSYSARMWNKNFNAKTFQADVNFTTEQIQDAKMDHDFDLLEFGETILQDALSQSINNHLLSYIFAAGWSHHKAVNELSGLNLNTFIGASSNTGHDQEYVGLDGQLKKIDGVSGILPATGAIAENMSTLQKRIVTRMFYASTIIKNRGRAGKGDKAVVNGTHATAIRDIRGFSLAPFQNNLSDDASLSALGDFYGISVYEDSLMDMMDGRIAVFNGGDEKRAGLKFCPYILGEKLTTTAEGTMQQKTLLKSRYCLAECGSHPEAQYMTMVVEADKGYSIV